MSNEDLRALAEYDQARRAAPKKTSTVEKTGRATDTKFDGTEEVVIIYWRCSHCGNKGADKPDEVLQRRREQSDHKKRERDSHETPYSESFALERFSQPLGHFEYLP